MRLFFYMTRTILTANDNLWINKLTLTILYSICHEYFSPIRPFIWSVPAFCEAYPAQNWISLLASISLLIIGLNQSSEFSFTGVRSRRSLYAD